LPELIFNFIAATILLFLHCLFEKTKPESVLQVCTSLSYLFSKFFTKNYAIA